MGRHAEGWKLRLVRGIYQVRFTHDGTRHTYSTRETDQRAAARKAGEIYARVVSGVDRPRVHVTADLEDAVATWIAEITPGYDSVTLAAYERFANRWVVAFGTYSKLCSSAALTAYAFGRLKSSLRKTLMGEWSAMRGFLTWSRNNGLIAEVPELPEIPARMIGVRTGPQRAVPVELSREQVRAILDALPEWSLPRGPEREPVDPKALTRLHELAALGGSIRSIAMTLTKEGYRRPRGGPWHNRQVERALKPSEPTRRYAIRSYFEFAYETGLRPSTIQSIRVPNHWRPGAAYLQIEDAIDKARFGRQLPLTERARLILEEHAPKEGGIVFERHNYYRYFKRALETLGIRPDAAPYDLRHARATHLLEDTGNLPGVAFVLGHRRVTTTNRYAKATQRAGESVIWGSDSGTGSAPERKKPGRATKSGS